MKTSKASIATGKASAYIHQICGHFARSTTASYTEMSGTIEFAEGRAELASEGGELRFEIFSESFDGIAKIKYRIVTFLEELGIEEGSDLVWEDYPLPPEPDWAELGRQLGRPQGDAGRQTGIGMNHANMGMILRSFELLEPAPEQQVLELGPGNGAHLRAVVERWPGLTYSGVEISETMIEAAGQVCEGMADISFILTEGRQLPFADASFDRIVTVNTIYFWRNPAEYASEIRRVLKRGSGVFCLAFIDAGFMRQLPFTRDGFELYDIEKATRLLVGAGFRILKTVSEPEEIRSNTGQKVKRTRIMVLAAWEAQRLD